MRIQEDYPIGVQNAFYPPNWASMPSWSPVPRWSPSVMGWSPYYQQVPGITQYCTIRRKQRPQVGTLIYDFNELRFKIIKKYIKSF